VFVLSIERVPEHVAFLTKRERPEANHEQPQTAMPQNARHRPGHRDKK
jgi:hypothetical protein